MNPFIAHPGEAIVGLGIDFAEHLVEGETVESVAITPDAGISVESTTHSGTIVTAKISIAPTQTPADLYILFAVTGSLGSVRKGWRLISVRTKSG